MKKLDSKGFAHQVLILALVVVAVIGGIGSYIYLKSSSAATIPQAKVTIQNFGAGAQADVVVTVLKGAAGKTVSSGTDVNTIIANKHADYRFSGAPNSSYKGSSFQSLSTDKPASSSTGKSVTLSKDKYYAVFAVGGSTGFSHGAYGYASTTNLCDMWVDVYIKDYYGRISYSNGGGYYYTGKARVQACTLNNTKTSVSYAP